MELVLDVKTCNKCGQEKPLHDFYKSAYYCKLCDIARSTAYAKAHRHQANRVKRAYLAEKPEKRLLWAATKRAKEKGLEFNITEDDIVIPTHCPYLRISLTTTAPRGSPRTNIASLDRIDSSQGYTKGNVEVISHLANTMKSNATREQLVSFAEEILRRHKN